MGILQATGTQTDTVAAFWFVVLLYYFGCVVRTAEFRWPPLVALAAALGLAVLTKGTVYLFAPAFLLGLACWLIKVLRWRALAAFAVIVMVFLVFNAAHYSRNWRVYDHPLGPREEPMPNTKYGLEARTPGALLSNFSKHVGTHINTPGRLAARAPMRDFDPEAVLLLDQRPQPEKVSVNGRDFLRRWSKDRVAIYWAE